MSLKSIQKNYITLLKVFSDAGIVVNESQKNSLDNFIQDLQKTINKTRDEAILETKKLVEEKLEQEYREVVESIIQHQKEHSEIAGKIQEKVTQINESNKIADQVDKYLGECLDEILPQKTIVDYKKMKKLEKIQESLKEMLSVSEVDIDNKASTIKEDLEKKNTELEDKVLMYEKKIDQSNAHVRELETQMSVMQAKEFIQNKTKDLPVIEQSLVTNKTRGMTLESVQKNYAKILESVKTQIMEDQEIKEKNLEEELTNILERKRSESSTETNSDKEAEGTEVVSQNEDGDSDYKTEEEKPQDSVRITESQMQFWIDTLNRITPNK